MPAGKKEADDGCSTWSCQNRSVWLKARSGKPAMRSFSLYASAAGSGTLVGSDRSLQLEGLAVSSGAALAPVRSLEEAVKKRDLSRLQRPDLGTDVPSLVQSGCFSRFSRAIQGAFSQNRPQQVNSQKGLPEVGCLCASALSAASRLHRR